MPARRTFAQPPGRPRATSRCRRPGRSRRRPPATMPSSSSEAPNRMRRSEFSSPRPVRRRAATMLAVPVRPARLVTAARLPAMAYSASGDKPQQRGRSWPRRLMPSSGRRNVRIEAGDQNGGAKRGAGEDLDADGEPGSGSVPSRTECRLRDCPCPKIGRAAVASSTRHRPVPTRPHRPFPAGACSSRWRGRSRRFQRRSPAWPP